MNKACYAAAGLVFLCFVTGCSIRPEGVGVGFIKPTTPQQWDEYEAQLLENSKAAAEQGIEKSERLNSGIIVIGRTGPFRDFSNRKELATEFKRYIKAHESFEHDKQILTYREFEQAFDGWTTLRFAHIPLIGFQSVDVYVGKNEADAIGFSSVAGTLLFTTREDLVVAVSTLEKPYYVIEERLCEDGKTFTQCASHYKIGRYDLNTGQQLTGKLAVKPNGRVIDVKTFKLKQPPDDEP